MDLKFYIQKNFMDLKFYIQKKFHGFKILYH